MIPASHPPVARPLALRSTFNRAPSSFWRLQGTGVITTRPSVDFDSVPESCSLPTSHSKTTAAARGTARSKRIRGRGYLDGLERHHGWNDRLVCHSHELLGFAAVANHSYCSGYRFWETE